MKKFLSHLSRSISTVFNAFRIFDPKLLPSRDSTDFKCYGMDEVKTIGHHFCEKDIDKLTAEWGHFKFDMLELKYMESSLVLLSTSKQNYPLMSFIADVCRTALSQMHGQREEHQP